MIWFTLLFVSEYPFVTSVLILIFSLVAQMVKNPPAKWETQVWSLGQEDPWRKNGNPLQYSCLENSMDRGDWGGYSPRDRKETDVTERITLWLKSN